VPFSNFEVIALEARHQTFEVAAFQPRRLPALWFSHMEVSNLEGQTQSDLQGFKPKTFEVPAF